MIIKSLLDIDQYKLSMCNVVFQRFPEAYVEYEFVCRDEGIDFTPYFKEIKHAIFNLKALSLNNYEVYYLESLNLFSDAFLAYLLSLRLRPSEEVDIRLIEGKLQIKVAGLWKRVIFYETFILSIVNEIYFKDKPNVEGNNRLDAKIELIKEAGEWFKFADFGTRRRYSFNWQDTVLTKLLDTLPNNLVGTSNVHLARMYGIKPIGTMAHEYIMAFQGIVHPVNSQGEALKVWADVYRGNLGIALTDTINMDSFLKDFDLYYAKLYDGLRHDSGDPYVWGEKAIQHYKKLGINTKTKSLVFSDGLNFKTAIKLYHRFKFMINVSFGIGTNLTNDCGPKPLSIVMKMTRFNGLPVAKISDEPSKAICKSDSFLKYLKEIFDIKEEK